MPQTCPQLLLFERTWRNTRPATPTAFPIKLENTTTSAPAWMQPVLKRAARHKEPQQDAGRVKTRQAQKACLRVQPARTARAELVLAQLLLDASGRATCHVLSPTRVAVRPPVAAVAVLQPRADLLLQDKQDMQQHNIRRNGLA